MRIPVLTYHSMQILGNSYASNDHYALAEDLTLINSLRLRIIPLRQVVETLLGKGNDDLERTIAISFDDGSDFDWQDIRHPDYGLQKSMANILLEFQDGCPGIQPSVHATSFVIASPQARAALDVTCMAGRGWWSDNWWRRAYQSGQLDIGNHSWDHNHKTLAQTAQRSGIKGRFSVINCYEDADTEIRQASDYIQRQLGRPFPMLFAYPYGEWNDYLVHEYFPRYQVEHQISAAFTTDGKPVEKSTSRWLIPRYVFGEHWRSPDELLSLLRDTK